MFLQNLCATLIDYDFYKFSYSLQPEWPQDTKALMLYLHMLVTFTNIGTWKVLHNKQGKESQAFN